MHPSHPLAPRLDAERERVVAVLCEHFAHDNLSDQALESRLDAAHAAVSVAELATLLQDLPALPIARQNLAPASASSAVRRVRQVAERQTVIAVMGGTERKGSWTLPRQLHLFAMMGGAELDLREARFGPGVTSITIFAVMGGVEIIVPPGVLVEMDGVALMGGFSQQGRSELPTQPDAPVLRVSGFVMMGGVNLKVRYPGESSMQAFKRHFRELQAEYFGPNHRRLG